MRLDEMNADEFDKNEQRRERSLSQISKDLWVARVSLKELACDQILHSALDLSAKRNKS
jgi:hypothetical protein